MRTPIGQISASRTNMPYLKGNMFAIQMLSEIKIHQSLRHKHVVRFDLFLEDNENVYLVLELCGNKVCRGFCLYST
jgi:serine/threonine protein kinase